VSVFWRGMVCVCGYRHVSIIKLRAGDELGVLISFCNIWGVPVEDRCVMYDLICIYLATDAGWNRIWLAVDTQWAHNFILIVLHLRPRSLYRLVEHVDSVPAFSYTVFAGLLYITEETFIYAYGYQFSPMYSIHNSLLSNPGSNRKDGCKCSTGTRAYTPPHVS